MEKYHRKYRIPSARLQTWDYGSQAAYFITICTQNRQHFFGEIVQDKMEYSPIGLIVETEWTKTPALRLDMNLELGEYIVMPNHFHAILIIGINRYNTVADTRRDAMHGVSTNTTTTQPDTDSGTNTDTGINDTHTNQFGPQSKNLASIVRGFKSAVTTYARKNSILDFAWQSRFHDHIIRNAASFERIQNYIANNPSKWKEDKLNCP